MPGSDAWRKRIVTFHQRLAQILIEKKLYEEAVNHLDNITEYLQLHNSHDEVCTLLVLRWVRELPQWQKLHPICQNLQFIKYVIVCKN